VWLVAEDAKGNVQSTPTKVDVETASDATPPVFAASRTLNVQDFAFDVEVTADEPGVTFYVVLSNSAAAPTAAQVRAGSGGSETPVAAGSWTMTISDVASSTTVSSGIAHSTSYKVYIVAEVCWTVRTWDVLL